MLLQVIVFSMVRSNTQGDVGFLSEQRRNNVAITRARRLLCVAAARRDFALPL
jgi:superfamily I DNA and/or RNA helicase